ncbi:MAG: disulfide bond formation protein B [Acidobacteria bacterium]|nr:disulfide bond formation protein B [Acidobacteriota bacterium]MCW5948276.1 disulfide bond formation protein B [Pyrinomonadaceae bacterium]
MNESERDGYRYGWLIVAAWAIALAGTVGSLFFSEVMGYPPCSLCWYQRIALYPIVIVLAVGVSLGDRRSALYALPLAAVGFGVAVYHNMLYYGIIPAELQPCTEGTPCTAVQLELLGFITIPLMSLASFAFITAALGLFAYRNK